jgi:sialic acid synthase
MIKQNYKSPVIIAEIGCNHMGQIELAKEFIDVSKNFCDLKYVKFQKRDPKTLLTTKKYNSPHPVPENSFGKTYGIHRENLEFSLKQHKELKLYCEKKQITYSTSVWDLKSAKDITSINPKFIKIGSATNTNYEVMIYLLKNFKGKIHVSLGMTTVKEEEKLIKLFAQYKRSKDLILYACTSAYPVETKDICLLEITRLIQKYRNKNLASDIGFSGHHKGIAIDVAAYSLGANYIERHFTLDRTWKGTDHSASLEPDGIRRLKRNLEETHKALMFKSKSILEVEKNSRKKLKFKIR